MARPVVGAASAHLAAIAVVAIPAQEALADPDSFRRPPAAERDFRATARALSAAPAGPPVVAVVAAAAARSLLFSKAKTVELAEAAAWAEHPRFQGRAVPVALAAVAAAL
jgi:hypothetical protein